MATAQILLSFALWLGFAAWIAIRYRRTRRSDDRAVVGSALRGASFLLASVVILAAGYLLAEVAGGWREARLGFGAWVIVTAAGLAFVYLQALAALEIARHARPPVTSEPPSPSQHQTPKETQR